MATTKTAATERPHGLTDQQIAKLLEGIHRGRIAPDNQGNSSLAGWDVRAHLLRLFGWGGFSTRITRSEIVYCGPTEQAGKSGFDAVVACDVELTISDPHGNVLAVFEDGNVGEAQNQRTRGAALKLAWKSARTGAVKRAATYLGDQFGLSLAAKGRDPAAPVVVRTLAWDHDDAQAGDLAATDTTVAGLGDDDDRDGFVPGDADPGPAEQPPAQPQPQPSRRRLAAVPLSLSSAAVAGGWSAGGIDWTALAASDDVDWTWLAAKASMSPSKLLTRLRKNGFDDLTDLNQLAGDDLRRALTIVRQSIPVA